MEPIKFKEQNIVFAENDPEFFPLPAYQDEKGEVVTCWKIPFWKRVKLLFTGKVWINVMTYHMPIQPLWATTDYPFIKHYKNEKRV